MRLCRFRQAPQAAAIGFYGDEAIVPLAAAAEAYRSSTSRSLELPPGDDLLAFLPPDGTARTAAETLADFLAGEQRTSDLTVPADKVDLLP